MWRYEMISPESYRVYEHTGDAGFFIPNRLLAGRIADLLNADDAKRQAVADQITALLGAIGQTHLMTPDPEQAVKRSPRRHAV